MRSPKCILCGKPFLITEMEEDKGYFAEHTCISESSKWEYTFEYLGPIRTTPEKAMAAIHKRFVKED